MINITILLFNSLNSYTNISNFFKKLLNDLFFKIDFTEEVKN